MFMFPLFYDILIESAFIPQTVEGIFCTLGKILAEQAADILHLCFRRNA